jgi:hypothetical protein
LQQKTQDTQTKGMIDILSEKLKVMIEQLQLQNNREERASRERIEAAKLANERMQLAEGALIHPLSTPVAQQFAGQWPGYVPLPSNPTPGPTPGRVL